MKFLVVGLGNIGLEYTYTRHNIGFLILDRMASKYQVTWKTERYADVTEIKIKNKKATLIKPSTYMNLSGKAYKYWLEKVGVPIEKSMALVDDVALDFGKIRIKTNGSAGGHNGLSSIEEELKSKNYTRLRFGIGNNFPKGSQVNYVLGKWNDEEVSLLPDSMDRAILAIEESILAGFTHAMNKYNQ